ncbi:adenylosuccinate synthase [bacterium]|nr:adenylosuccinate synthase [bacterium]
MPAAAVIGLQWGDEGKGKVIDALARDSKLVVRYQGGANAGHTVHANGEKFVFHLVPTGALWPGVTSVIGPGVVVDAPGLLGELDELKARGVRLEGRLVLAERAHVVFPYHKALDEAREASRGKDSSRLGTTKRGIGPCYADKASRTGIRVIDLYDEQRFSDLLRRNLDEKNAILKHLYGRAPLEFDPIREQYSETASRLRPYVGDSCSLVQGALEHDERVLFEGAQGAMLDLDHGTYPYVTSSSTLTDGISSGAGVPPTALGRALGVLKAYTTRVGDGPFPTEIPGEQGQKLREAGGEYGATTGRPRRTGWLDVVQLRYAARLSGTDGLVLTKLDVLSGMTPIKVCVAYEVKGTRLATVPADPSVLEAVTPVYEELPGFEGALDPTDYDRFPKAARDYVAYIERALGVPVSFVSTGPARDAFIRRGPSVWS